MINWKIECSRYYCSEKCRIYIRIVLFATLKDNGKWARSDLLKILAGLLYNEKRE